MTVYLTKVKNKKKLSWKGAVELPVTEYSISESGFREKTASFTTTKHIDLTTGVYMVLIASSTHENFTGFIMSEDYKPKEHEYSYKCKDFHVLYNNKITKSYKKTTGRDIIIDALTWGDIFGSHPKKELKKYARQLNGLFKNSKYEMQNYGYNKRFNPMTKKYKKQKIQNKSCWEVIKAYTLGTGAYLDLKINDYGTMIIRPFNINRWRKPVAEITEVHDNLSLNVSTEGLIDLSGGGSIYNIKLPEPQEEKIQSDTASNKSDGNPYQCKNKEIWLNMDDCGSSSSDWSYLRGVANELKKLGWKTHIVGRGPGYFSNKSEMVKAKGGIYLTINNGMDTENIRECTHADYHAGLCKKNNVLPAIFWIPPADRKSSFLKGCKRYAKLETAHDAKGVGGAIPYPASHMAKSGVPFGFVSNKHAKTMADLINKGGDSPKANQNNFFKIKCKGFYANVGDKHYGY